MLRNHLPRGACLSALVLAGCGPAAPVPADPHAHAAHGHSPHQPMDGSGHHGHDPLVHRFQNASEWAKDFDNPERDAWQRPAEVVALLQLAPGLKVADLGAGTGYFEPHLSRAVGPTGSVLALDIEDSMVRYITERAARESLTNVTATKVPLDGPGLAPASVDRILVVDTWHHIPERAAYAAKLRDALTPGGFVAIVDFTPTSAHGPPVEHRIPQEQTQKELESAGLVAEIAVETLPDQYVVLGRKPAK